MICASLSAQVLTRPPCHHSLPATANLCPRLWQEGASPTPRPRPLPGGQEPRPLHPLPSPLPTRAWPSQRGPPSPPLSPPASPPLPSAQPIRPLTPGAADKLFLSLALCLSLGDRRGGGAGGEGEEMGSFMLSKARYINYKTAICRVKVC